MTETVAQQMARLHAEVQNQRAQLTMRPLVTKYMSLVSKWTGTDKGVPLNEFLEATEVAARIRSWSKADMVQIAILRLFDSARVFTLERVSYTTGTYRGRILKLFSRDVSGM